MGLRIFQTLEIYPFRWKDFLSKRRKKGIFSQTLAIFDRERESCTVLRVAFLIRDFPQILHLNHEVFVLSIMLHLFHEVLHVFQTIAERRSQKWERERRSLKKWERERERRSEKRLSAESAAHFPCLRSSTVWPAPEPIKNCPSSSQMSYFLKFLT